MKFKATHVLTITRFNGLKSTEFIPVMRDGGSLYTEEEWDAIDAADWTLEENDEILFQGRVPICLAYSLNSITKK